MTDDAKVAALREQLPATGAGIYLDTATRGPLPVEVAAAMHEADDWELRVGRVWEGRDEDVAQRTEEARAVVAALIGAEPANVVLTHGLTDALELAQERQRGKGRIVDISNRACATPINVGELDADAVVLAGDRWLLGPEATGAMWLADAGATAASRTLPRTALVGLARSVGWLEMYVGLEWIYERTAILAGRLFASLLATEGIEVLTPRDDLVAIVSFRLANWPADEAAEELSRRAQAIVRPLTDLNAIRASVGWFNTEAELDRFAEAVAELASYTPDTLPRRPSPIVLADT